MVVVVMVDTITPAVYEHFKITLHLWTLCCAGTVPKLLNLAASRAFTGTKAPRPKP